MEFIEIKPGGDLTLFNSVRTGLYPGHPSPDNAASEYLHACYVLMDHETAAGRFALYRNGDLMYQSLPTACIGNYECIDNLVYSQILLQKAISESKTLGADVLIGPMNGSTWENYRFADRRNTNQFFLELSNYPYYNEQFLSFGFEKIGAYYSSVDEHFKYQRKGIAEREKQLAHSGIKFKNIDLHNYPAELEKIFELSSRAFRHSFLYTEFSRESFYEKYLPLSSLIDPDYVVLAEDIAGRLSGFIFCMNDLLHPVEKRLIIKTIARLPGKGTAGIGEILGNIVYERAIKDGYTSIIHALMNAKGASANHSLRRAENIINTYSLYAKFISL